MYDSIDFLPPICADIDFRPAPESADSMPIFFPPPPLPADDFQFIGAATGDPIGRNFTAAANKENCTVTPSQSFPANSAVNRQHDVPRNGLWPIAEPLVLAGLKEEAEDQLCCSSLPGYFQRSFSSHSLEQLRAGTALKQNGFHSYFASLQEKPEFSDSLASSMRRVLSTGDLQRIDKLQLSQGLGSPSTHENSSIEGLCKVGRYSAEERKERIERYRSKRNQRNFHKKIKYACRKTLADSRPRVRGRFARNEELGENSQTRWNQIGEDDEDDSEVWVNFLNVISMNLIP